MAKSKNPSYANINGRAVLYGVLIIVAAYYLLPLILMIMTSFRSMDEIRLGQLIEWPKSFSLDAWSMAWSEVQIGAREERGLRPYFINSILMVIPSVAISTILGALNGYVLSFWKFRGSELFFAALLIGCFLPFQAILLPQSQLLGWLGLSGSLVGLILTHVVYGVSFLRCFSATTTSICRTNWSRRPSWTVPDSGSFSSASSCRYRHRFWWSQ